MGFKPPPDIKLNYIPNDTNMGEMLLAGKLHGALRYLAGTDNLVDRSSVDLYKHPDFKTLFPDPHAEGVQFYKKTGIYPINHCMVIKRDIAERHPSPVPVTLSQIVMLNKAANKNGAKVFINWMLSREGQILQYADSYAVPVHKALQSDKFVPFADTIIGKPHLIRDDTLLGGEMHKRMQKLWDANWTSPVGKDSKKKKRKGKKRKKKE